MSSDIRTANGPGLNEPNRKMQGLQLPCPMCGEPNATLDFCLETKQFFCWSCRRGFTTSIVWRILENWPPVVHWADSLPQESD